MVLVGRVARPHGRFGHVMVNAETDFPSARFAPGSVLHTRRDGRDEQLVVTDLRMHQGRPLVGFEGVGTITDAEALAGLELRIPEDALTPLPEGTYYEHELVGCEAVTVAGQSVGVVRAVEGTAGGARLVIGQGRGEIQIPLAREICVAIDVERRRITVDPPEGLLDLNA